MARTVGLGIQNFERAREDNFFFNNTFKTNPALYRAVMTGIAGERIRKYGFAFLGKQVLVG